MPLVATVSSAKEKLSENSDGSTRPVTNHSDSASFTCKGPGRRQAGAGDMSEANLKEPGCGGAAAKILGEQNVQRQENQGMH